MNNKTKISLGFALIASFALAASVAHAQLVPPVEGMENVNIIGLGAGVAPDYMGSGHKKAGAAPIFRYQFSGSERYFLLLGPTATLNIMDDPNWRFGPIINYRFGRGSSVDDPTVKQMVGINGTAEAGVFLTYRLKLSEQKMHQINFSGDIEGSSNGTLGNLRMMWWQPLSQSTILNLGIGTTIASSKWMQTYFGVTNASDIALYPSLNGLPFNAGSGVKGVQIPFGITQMITKEWLVSVGGRYEKLTNDAKNSPVTSVSGNSNQWIGGIGVSYLF